MKTLVVRIAAFLLLLGLSPAQVEDKHFTITTPDHGLVHLKAQTMLREGPIVHLKGGVEIDLWGMWPPQGGAKFRIHADEIDYHVDTGAMETKGPTTMTPVAEGR